jgi:hypothetical protein
MVSLSLGFGHGDSFRAVFDFAVKKWGQAPACSRNSKGFSRERRSQSPFFLALPLIAR